MRILFYDTETSGMPLWDQPSASAEQPHIVQLAAALVDAEQQSVISEIDLLIRPDGWECSPATIAIHGITNERALEEGIDEALGVNALYELWRLCDLRVGHAESFDARLMRIALKRFVGSLDADGWKEGPAACTKARGAGVVKGRGGDRPHLADYYLHYTGKELENAHNARADMHACMEVFFAQGGVDAIDKPAKCPPVEPQSAPSRPLPEAVQQPDGWHIPYAHARHLVRGLHAHCGCANPSDPVPLVCACGAGYSGGPLASSTADFYCYDCHRKVPRV